MKSRSKEGRDEAGNAKRHNPARDAGDRAVGDAHRREEPGSRHGGLREGGGVVAAGIPDGRERQSDPCAFRRTCCACAGLGGRARRRGGWWRARRCDGRSRRIGTVAEVSYAGVRVGGEADAGRSKWTASRTRSPAMPELLYLLDVRRTPQPAHHPPHAIHVIDAAMSAGRSGRRAYRRGGSSPPEPRPRWLRRHPLPTQVPHLPTATRAARRVRHLAVRANRPSDCYAALPRFRLTLTRSKVR